LAARNLVFYTAVNPGILNSGIGSESKFTTLQLLPKEYIPKSVLHKETSAIADTLKGIEAQGISYPMIVKPDIGFRGLLVKKIEDEQSLVNYLKKYPVDFIIQEFLTHEYECGVFYYRHPNEEKGTSLKLSSIGNHSKGTRFINGNHLINKELEESLNKLNHQVEGWFYGRLDVKYNSLEELNQGKFKILELNGILAEPTHIYDATKMSYWKALKTIRTHWKQLYKIARYNHKHHDVAYRKMVPFLKEMFALKAYSNRLKKLSQQ
jgi:hypothetical protein